ncbi:hypothetical protein NADFUDRAFT_49500 [Nadsonia fulvescens var. elongata DSM 6958]|uniref:Uncharacterized protein n=1 Tax=Nadsonia fulvescens var. elongata DSM 6958 TaxID=857566 RepID=A0A1E3PP99_9ASCO|nr:hypothetical protein NADFUDRAFT_49500 [Nadsonia fulvescens var. elongata DSM 6958]
MSLVFSSDIPVTAVVVFRNPSTLINGLAHSNPSSTDSLQNIIPYTNIVESSTLVTSEVDISPRNHIDTGPNSQVLDSSNYPQLPQSPPLNKELQGESYGSFRNIPISVNLPDFQDSHTSRENTGNLLSAPPQWPGQSFSPSRVPRSPRPFSHTADGSSVSTGLQITMSLLTILPLAYIRSIERPRRLLAVWILDLARQFLGYSFCGMFDFIGHELFDNIGHFFFSNNPKQKSGPSLGSSSGVIPLADRSIQGRDFAGVDSSPPFPLPESPISPGSLPRNEIHPPRPAHFRRSGPINRTQRRLTQDFFEIFPGMIFLYFINLLLLRFVDYLWVRFKDDNGISSDAYLSPPPQRQKPSCFINGNYGTPLRLSWFFYQTLIFGFSLHIMRLILRKVLEWSFPSIFLTSSAQLFIWSKLNQISSHFVRNTITAIISFLVHVIQFITVDKLLRYRSSSSAACKRIDETSVSNLIRTTQQRQSRAEDSNWADNDQVNNQVNDLGSDQDHNYYDHTSELSWESWAYRKIVQSLKSFLEDDDPAQCPQRRRVIIDEESGLESYEITELMPLRVSVDQQNPPHSISPSQNINNNTGGNNDLDLENHEETVVGSTPASGVQNDRARVLSHTSTRHTFSPSTLDGDLKIFVREPAPSSASETDRAFSTTENRSCNTDNISDASIDVDLLTARLLNTVAISATAQARPYLFSSAHTTTTIPTALGSISANVSNPVISRIDENLPLDLGGIRLNLNSAAIEHLNDLYDYDDSSNSANSDSGDSSVSTSTSMSSLVATDNNADYDTGVENCQSRNELVQVARENLPSYDDSQRQHAELLRDAARSQRQQAIISDLKLR